MLATRGGGPRSSSTSLSKKEKKYFLSSVDTDARMREYAESFRWLEESRIVNIARNATDPSVALAMSQDYDTQKLYVADTGLLVTQAFESRPYTENEIYRELLLDQLSVNKGMVAEFQGAKGEAEDIAREILLKLVDILRHGKYSASAGKFRCYLATLIRREVIDFWRRGVVRAVDAQISLDNPDAGLDIPCDFDAGDELDLKWRLARHAAAVDHALTKTALSQQSKDIYRAYVLDEESLKSVAKRFGVSENTVAQTKTRVNKMIAALEEGMA